MVRIIRSGVSGRLQPGHWTEATRRTEKSCHWRCELEANGTDGGDTMVIVVAASSSILIAGQGRGGGGGGDGDVPYFSTSMHMSDGHDTLSTGWRRSTANNRGLD